MNGNDTIVAISSALGNAERGILRLSGAEAWGVVERMVEEGEMCVGLRRVRVRDPGIGGMLLLFEGPRSFTGERVAELHVPGSLTLLKMLVEQAIGLGARQAEGGEFSARAFFHGKIDLTQAEGIAATIAATSERQLRAAATLREGELFKWTTAFAERVARVLALLEAGIDFSDEPGVSFISGEEVRGEVAELRAEVAGLRGKSVRWERIEVEPTVVLFGVPNVGKSSLINALCGSERAIVSAVAGTTRDVLAARLVTGRGVVRVLDVAGVEEVGDQMNVAMGESRGRALREADVVVVVGDSVETLGRGGDLLRRERAEGVVVWVWNKCDLEGRGEEEAGFFVSAKTGVGVEGLRGEIERLAYARESLPGERITLNQRHHQILLQVEEALGRAGMMAEEAGEESPELLAADLRAALDAVGQISGTISPDEILGRIFSSFCIGK